MKIAITGGTGLIGSAVTDLLLSDHHEVYILTRSRKVTDDDNLHFVEWLGSSSSPEKELDGMDAFINLAGESIHGRWTEEKKKNIMESRLQATEEVLRILGKLPEKPSVLVNASAVGYYGSAEQERFTERSSPKNENFLSAVAQKWEQKASEAKELGIRTVFTRFGVVLSKKGGALSQMEMPYKLFAGGRIGSGRQWISWVHLEDAARLIAYAVESEIEGPLNVTSPFPVQNNDFGKELGEIIRRPHWLPAPALAIKTVLGEMSVLILEGQHAYPEKALQSGFKFCFPRLQEALKDLLK
ncbi:TIGR01777 family oxidoreductase [Fictibacillus terranigra]|uniref:TIGR01777 family oxidoreductase n=1 Tax=Fictibacillus terranigra TaxID=3058424 RepID=A0ABT8EBF6_9BACL|nr:TIGR01777 family oxidoreductase [Fictibacillus sp. CENA-BCM004]MDN4075231.1 TIGR01777 family oxidoreductase [Fictibacillus sp. CENA-BCM004]